MNGLNFFNQFDSTKLPKSRVELHLHLDCSMRLATVWSLALRKGMELHCDSLKELEKKVVRTRPGTLGSFLAPGDIFIPVVRGDEKALEQVAIELCEDQAAEGVAYFEARYAPHLLATETLPPAKVVDIINRGLAMGEDRFGVKVRSILCCLLGHQAWAHEVVELCDQFRNEGVVGIDVAGDEANLPMSPEIIDAFQEAARLGIHRTAHAAEVGPPSNLLRALNELKAERIGHGYQAFKDKSIYDIALAADVHFEICPSSSFLTGAVPLSISKHPVVQLAEDDANYSINKDDPTLIGNTLDAEYKVLQALGLKEVHFIRANFNAARAAFLPEAEKRILVDQLKTEYRAFQSQN